MTTFSKSPTQGKGTKKNRMAAFRIDEISIVDRPAQGPALTTLMKRESEEEKKERKMKEEQRRGVEKAIILTSESDNHQHAIHLDEYDMKNGGGTTNYTTGEEGGDHSHPYVINSDGSVEIGVSLGHTHEVDLFAFIQRMNLLQAVEKKALAQFGPSDYAYVPDPNDPDSWQFRLTKSPGGPPDRRLVGSVAASLAKRGALRAIPKSKRTAVIGRTRQAWLKSNAHKSLHDLPQILKRGFSNTTSRGN